MKRLALAAFLFVLPSRAQAEKHIITVAQAQAMIQTYQAQNSGVGSLVPPVSALIYHADAIRKLLAQSGATSLGIYKGIDNGKETFVMMARDADLGPCPPGYMVPSGG